MKTKNNTSHIKDDVIFTLKQCIVTAESLDIDFKSRGYNLALMLQDMTNGDYFKPMAHLLVFISNENTHYVVIGGREISAYKDMPNNTVKIICRIDITSTSFLEGMYNMILTVIKHLECPF